MDTQTETTETESEVTPETETTDVPVETTPETPTPVDRPPLSRKDRKRERIDVEAANRERDELKRTLEQERQERQRIANEVAEMRGRLEERQKQTQQVDKQSETKSKIAELRKQAKFHLFLSAKATDQATADREWDEHKRLEDEANDLRDDLRDEARWEKRRGELTSQIPDPVAQQEINFLNSRFPWLESNHEAQALADAKLKALMRAGRQPNRETAVEAITYAGKVLGLGGNGTPPTNGQRQLYAGIPSGEGAGAGGDERKTIKMGRHEEAMARAAYPHLEAKEAYKQWAKDVTARMNDDG